MDSIFVETLTVEQFKSRMQTNHLKVAPLIRKDGTSEHYKDAQGNITSVIRRIVRDDAGNIVANCSRAVAEDIQNGKPLANIAVGVQLYTNSNGEESVGYKFYHPYEGTVEVVL